MRLRLHTAFREWRSTSCHSFWLLVVACVAGLALSGCAQQHVSNGYASEPVGSIATRGAPRSNLEIAQQSFQRQAYGLAEKHFRLAIEEDRRNAEAWLGLAASYDQIRRFDLADRAYDELRALAGDSAAVLNNMGYSHTLRGNYGKAASLLARAQRLAPEDERVLENIDFLNRQRAGQ